MAQVHLVSHPLVQHKLTIKRQKYRSTNSNSLLLPLRKTTARGSTDFIAAAQSFSPAFLLVRSQTPTKRPIPHTS